MMQLKDLKPKLTIQTSERQSDGEHQHLSFIDALRGWAFLGVLLVHSSSAVSGLPDLVRELTLRGKYGVQLLGKWLIKKVSL
jgi:peptidoglycan/LPS O-acetylase OafA/YrhL